jgi:class 3 adenylate cyclase
LTPSDFEHADRRSEDHRQPQQAFAALEAQRETLGDAVVEAALAPLGEKLAALEKAEVGKRSLAGERKRVTVMFADISGFTPLSETLDPEPVRDLINTCFEHLVPIVEKYEGTVDKFMGDNVMALFGAPVAHENDPERALRAAMDMRQALAKFSAEHGVELGLHFGINTGLVIAGGLGTRQRQKYSQPGHRGCPPGRHGGSAVLTGRELGSAAQDQRSVGHRRHAEQHRVSGFAPGPPRRGPNTAG